MIQLTEKAITKVSEIMGQQDPKPTALRISVVGGGCSGFQYSMAFENNQLPLDKVYKFERAERVRRPGQHALPRQLPRGLRRDDGRGWIQVRKPQRHLYVRLRQLVPGLTFLLL